MFTLGSKARDTVTGFTGTVTARAEYLQGATQVRLERLDNDGKLSAEWFDENRLAEEPAYRPLNSP